MLQNVLHKYGLSLPGHLALRSRLVMGADNSLDFLQVGRWQISGDGVLYSSRSIAESNCLGTVAACTEQPVKSSGYIGVAAANPVHHLNIPIRLFLIVLILAASYITEPKVWRLGLWTILWVEATMEMGNSSVKLFIISLAVPVFKKVSLAVSSEQKKMST